MRSFGQYASGPYRAVLERHDIVQSMSRRGNPLDNAPMESLFASLKTEHVHLVRYRTRAEAKAAVLQVRCAVYNGTLGTGFGQRFHAATTRTRPPPSRPDPQPCGSPDHGLRRRLDQADQERREKDRQLTALLTYQRTPREANQVPAAPAPAEGLAL